MVPNFEIIISDSKRLRKKEFNAISITHKGSYGVAFQLGIRAVGEDALELFESGWLKKGTTIWRVRAGYDIDQDLGTTDDLVQIAKNLTVGDVTYKCSTKELTVNAYGVSWRLRNSSKRVASLAGKTYADCAKEVSSRWDVPIRIAGGAYKALQAQGTVANPTPPQPPRDAAGGALPGITARAAQGNSTGRTVQQKSETDWNLLAKLGREIGFVITETPDGSSLYFGEGLEIGARPRIPLILGSYTTNGQKLEGNIQEFTVSSQLHNVPTEVLVTSIRGRTRTQQVVTVQELAEYHQVTDTPKKPTTPPRDAAGGALPGVTATAVAPTAPQATGQRRSAADFEDKPLSDLLGSTPYSNRLILTGAATGDARQRAINALALERLRLETGTVTMPADPKIVPGTEVIVRGDLIPKPLQGVWLVRDVSAELGSAGYSMTLTVCRNTGEA
jgi:hypothetical protein